MFHPIRTGLIVTMLAFLSLSVYPQTGDAAQDSPAVLQAKAKKGDAEAQFNLGLRYWNGEGVKQNSRQAAYWLEKAAEQGHDEADHDLGLLIAQERSADEASPFSPPFGRQAVLGDENIAALRQKAEAGEKEAQVLLGWRYEDGRGVKQSIKQAAFWYAKAAAQGYAPGQYKLGWLYANGVGANEGVERNEQKGANLFLKAARQGHAHAQYYLGMMHEYGLGVKENVPEALYWYKKAAEAGDIAAQCALAVKYERGEGIKQNKQQAVYWYKKAAEAGDIGAELSLKKLK